MGTKQIKIFFTFLSVLMMLFTSCDEPQAEVQKVEEGKLALEIKGIIEYELYKVENGDFIDVVFRVTNLTDQPKEFKEISESINANLKVQKKYIKKKIRPIEIKGEVNSEQITFTGTPISETTFLSNTRDGWEGPQTILGIAIPRGNFILNPGTTKEYMILSAFKRAELLKELSERKSEKLLIRAEFTNPGDVPVMTNEIELKE